jgi:hypothetical protein
MENIEKLGLSGGSQGRREVFNVFFQANFFVEHTIFSLWGVGRLEVTEVGVAVWKKAWAGRCSVQPRNGVLSLSWFGRRSHVSG